MNYEEKIKELTERIEVLEKAENKRIAKKKLEITVRIVEILVIIIVLFLGYIYVNNTYIQPYKEKIDYVNDKVEDIEEFVNSELDIFKKYNPFSN
jgi:hypothetical protein